MLIKLLNVFIKIKLEILKSFNSLNKTEIFEIRKSAGGQTLTTTLTIFEICDNINIMR